MKKKEVYTYVFGYFSNSMCEKKNVYMYFYFFLVIFQQLKKKKSTQKVQQKRIWATAQLSCKKKKNLCIATLQLYCKREG